MLKNFIAVLRENRSWLALALLFFVGGFALSYTALKNDPSLLKVFEATTLPMLEELSKEVYGSTPLQGIIRLFMHNLMSVAYIIFLGVALGLPSLLAALGNGTVLGLVVYQLSLKGTATLPFLLAGILPHGIFELPALFISIALGLKIGYHIVFPMPEMSRLDSIRYVFREIGISLPFIIALLAVAAVIEVLITPRIVLPFI